jgi:hypothetical protein
MVPFRDEFWTLCPLNVPLYENTVSGGVISVDLRVWSCRPGARGGCRGEEQRHGANRYSKLFNKHVLKMAKIL